MRKARFLPGGSAGKFLEASGRPGGTGNYGALTPPESYGISWGMPERIALRCIPPHPDSYGIYWGIYWGLPIYPLEQSLDSESQC
jgi:hypothetical protein